MKIKSDLLDKTILKNTQKVTTEPGKPEKMHTRMENFTSDDEEFAFEALFWGLNLVGHPLDVLLYKIWLKSCMSSIEPIQHNFIHSPIQIYLLSDFLVP